MLSRKSGIFFESYINVDGFTLANDKVWHYCESRFALSRSLCQIVKEFDGFTGKNIKKYFNCLACNKEIDAKFFKLYVYLNCDTNSKHSITTMSEREGF